MSQIDWNNLIIKDFEIKYKKPELNFNSNFQTKLKEIMFNIKPVDKNIEYKTLNLDNIIKNIYDKDLNQYRNNKLDINKNSLYNNYKKILNNDIYEYKYSNKIGGVLCDQEQYKGLDNINDINNICWGFKGRQCGDRILKIKKDMYNSSLNKYDYNYNFQKWLIPVVEEKKNIYINTNYEIENDIQSMGIENTINFNIPNLTYIKESIVKHVTNKDSTKYWGDGFSIKKNDLNDKLLNIFRQNEIKDIIYLNQKLNEKNRSITLNNYFPKFKIQKKDDEDDEDDQDDQDDKRKKNNEKLIFKKIITSLYNSKINNLYEDEDENAVSGYFYKNIKINKYYFYEKKEKNGESIISYDNDDQVNRNHINKINSYYNFINMFEEINYENEYYKNTNNNFDRVKNEDYYKYFKPEINVNNKKIYYKPWLSNYEPYKIQETNNFVILNKNTQVIRKLENIPYINNINYKGIFHNKNSIKKTENNFDLTNGYHEPRFASKDEEINIKGFYFQDPTINNFKINYFGDSNTYINKLYNIPVKLLFKGYYNNIDNPIINLTENENYIKNDDNFDDIFIDMFRIDNILDNIILQYNNNKIDDILNINSFNDYLKNYNYNVHNIPFCFFNKINDLLNISILKYNLNILNNENKIKLKIKNKYQLLSESKKELLKDVQNITNIKNDYDDKINLLKSLYNEDKTQIEESPESVTNKNLQEEFLIVEPLIIEKFLEYDHGNFTNLSIDEFNNKICYYHSNNKELIQQAYIKYSDKPDQQKYDLSNIEECYRFIISQKYKLRIDLQSIQDFTNDTDKKNFIENNTTKEKYDELFTVEKKDLCESLLLELLFDLFYDHKNNIYRKYNFDDSFLSPLRDIYKTGSSDYDLFPSKSTIIKIGSNYDETRSEIPTLEKKWGYVTFKKDINNSNINLKRLIKINIKGEIKFLKNDLFEKYEDNELLKNRFGLVNDYDYDDYYIYKKTQELTYYKNKKQDIEKKKYIIKQKLLPIIYTYNNLKKTNVENIEFHEQTPDDDETNQYVKNLIQLKEKEKEQDSKTIICYKNFINKYSLVENLSNSKDISFELWEVIYYKIINKNLDILVYDESDIKFINTLKDLQILQNNNIEILLSEKKDNMNYNFIIQKLLIEDTICKLNSDSTDINDIKFLDLSNIDHLKKIINYYDEKKLDIIIINSKDELNVIDYFNKIFLAILLQKENGTFILKTNIIFDKSMKHILYILSLFYEKIEFIKPFTSNIFSNELFIRCEDFNGLKYFDIDKVSSYFHEIKNYNKIIKVKNAIDSDSDSDYNLFINNINQINNLLIINQINYYEHLNILLNLDSDNNLNQLLKVYCKYFDKDKTTLHNKIFKNVSLGEYLMYPLKMSLLLINKFNIPSIWNMKLDNEVLYILNSIGNEKEIKITNIHHNTITKIKNNIDKIKQFVDKNCYYYTNKDAKIIRYNLYNEIKKLIDLLGLKKLKNMGINFDVDINDKKFYEWIISYNNDTDKINDLIINILNNTTSNSSIPKNDLDLFEDIKYNIKTNFGFHLDKINYTRCFCIHETYSNMEEYPYKYDNNYCIFCNEQVSNIDGIFNDFTFSNIYYEESSIHFELNNLIFNHKDVYINNWNLQNLKEKLNQKDEEVYVYKYLNDYFTNLTLEQKNKIYNLIVIYYHFTYILNKYLIDLKMQNTIIDNLLKTIDFIVNDINLIDQDNSKLDNEIKENIKKKLIDLDKSIEFNDKTKIYLEQNKLFSFSGEQSTKKRLQKKQEDVIYIDSYITNYKHKDCVLDQIEDENQDEISCVSVPWNYEDQNEDSYDCIFYPKQGSVTIENANIDKFEEYLKENNDLYLLLKASNYIYQNIILNLLIEYIFINNDIYIEILKLLSYSYYKFEKIINQDLSIEDNEIQKLINLFIQNLFTEQITYNNFKDSINQNLVEKIEQIRLNLNNKLNEKDNNDLNKELQDYTKEYNQNYFQNYFKKITDNLSNNNYLYSTNCIDNYNLYYKLIKNKNIEETIELNNNVCETIFNNKSVINKYSEFYYENELFKNYKDYNNNSIYFRNNNLNAIYSQDLISKILSKFNYEDSLQIYDRVILDPSEYTDLVFRTNFERRTAIYMPRNIELLGQENNIQKFYLNNNKIDDEFIDPQSNTGNQDIIITEDNFENLVKINIDKLLLFIKKFKYYIKYICNFKFQDEEEVETIKKYFKNIIQHRENSENRENMILAIPNNDHIKEIFSYENINNFVKYKYYYLNLYNKLNEIYITNLYTKDLLLKIFFKILLDFKSNYQPTYYEQTIYYLHMNKKPNELINFLKKYGSELILSNADLYKEYIRLYGIDINPNPNDITDHSLTDDDKLTINRQINYIINIILEDISIDDIDFEQDNEDNEDNDDNDDNNNLIDNEKLKINI